MILDDGIITVFRPHAPQKQGSKPRFEYALIWQSYYGELNFSTEPANPTDRRNEVQTDARVRILQNREIRKGDVAVLRDADSLTEDDGYFVIERAYHGADDDSGALISDLNLREVQPRGAR